MDTLFVIPEQFSLKNKEHISLLQQALPAINTQYVIDPKEAAERNYGETTQEAVAEFQHDFSLKQNIHDILSDTVEELNKQLEKLYRIGGFLFDSYGNPVSDVAVIISDTRMSRILGNAKSFVDGSYRIYPAIDPGYFNDEGLLRYPLVITISYGGLFLQEDIPIKAMESVINNSSGLFVKTGRTLYDSLIEALDFSYIHPEDLPRKKPEELLNISKYADTDIETIMRIMFAYMVAQEIPIFDDDTIIILFAYLYQNYPINVPIRLFDDSFLNFSQEEWDEYKNNIKTLILDGFIMMSSQQLIDVLTTAVNKKYIKYMSEIEIKDICYTFYENYIMPQILTTQFLEGDSAAVTLEELLNMAGIPNDIWPSICELFISHINDFDAFLSLLETDERFKAYKDSLILYFQLSRITRNFKPLIKIIARNRYTEIRNSVRFLGTLSELEWRTLINESGSCPPGFDDVTYANFLMDVTAELFPDMATIRDIRNTALIHEFPKLQEIQDYLLSQDNQNFDFLTDRLDPKELDDEFVREFREIQNVFRITPSPEAVPIMLGNRITSAGQVYFMGKKLLEERLISRLSQEDIDAIFAMSSARFSSAFNAFVNINHSFSAGTPYAVAREDVNSIDAVITELESEFPDIRDLFGSLDYCECEHDESFYSSAAYLADLLAFLDQRNTQQGVPVKDFLDYYSNNHSKLRRKDISKIYLNAHNTNTVMPYIDLVCEVLEEAVLRTAHPDYERTDADCQSTLSSKELLAAPEHILFYGETVETGETAYDILKEQIYPMFAPLNLDQTEVRAYLKKMGIDRYNLIETFQKSDVISDDYTNRDIAAEYFGLTAMEAKIVTGAYEDVTYRNGTWHELIPPTAAGNPYSMEIVNFMADSNLSAYEILDLTEVDWIGLQNSTITTDCSMEGKMFVGTPEEFDRAHRFIRLYRKSGWKILELNLLLKSPSVTRFSNIDTDNLDEEALHYLRLFRQQQLSLNLSVEELLACYDTINTGNIYEQGKLIPCIYDRIFLAPVMSNPPNDALLAIKTGGTPELSPEDENLIKACLSLSDRDYALLRSKVFGDAEIIDGSIDYLTYLYKTITMAKKGKFSFDEWYRFLALTERQDGASYTPPLFNELFEDIQQLKAANFTLADFEYLTHYLYEQPKQPSEAPLQGGYSPSLEASKLALPQTDIASLINEIKEARNTFETFHVNAPTEDDINKEQDSYFATDDYKSKFIAQVQQVGLYGDSDFIEEVIQVIECTKVWYKDEDDPNSEPMDDEWTVKRIASLFPPVAGYSVDLSNALYPYGSMESKDDLIERYTMVINYYNQVSRRIKIRDIIAEFYDISVPITDSFLGSVLFDDKLLIDILLSDSSVVPEADPYPVIPSDLWQIVVLMHKLVKTVKGNKITDDNMGLLMQIQEQLSFPWGDFSIYNPETVAQSVNFYQLLELSRMLSLQVQFGETDDSQTLFSIIEKDTLLDELLSALCNLTGWNADDIDFLRHHFNWDIDIDTFYGSVVYSRILKCLQLQDATAVSFDKLADWGIFNKDTANAKEVKEAAKMHYSNIDSWLDALPAVQAPIREAKSDALGSFLITCSWRTPSVTPTVWEDKLDIYGYFLLDTEVTSKLKTSRIVQATASVQVFVQRCALGLEPDVNINEDKDSNWKQWEWMKKYRLWEANRKIFLYPENWIEPELRDDKTPFFKEMEDELSQGEVTEELVETVFENYLQKLNDISKLFVCGVYNEVVNNNDGMEEETLTANAEQKKIETNTSTVNKLHVVARTRATPYEFYYRCYDLYNSTWTHWEKIDVDIKGDVVIPMVYNRRLHLFWLSKVEKSYSVVGENNNSKPTVYDYTEVQLGWTALRNKKWTKVVYSTKRHLIQNHFPVLNLSLIARYDNTVNEIVFDVYGFYKTDQNSNRSTNWLTGSFYFNGEVYRALSVFPITSILREMRQDERPELYLDTTPTGLRPTSSSLLFSNMWASRLYADYPLNSDTLDIYLPGNNSSPASKEEYIKILSTNRKDPNIVLMMHDFQDLWLSQHTSHDDFPLFYQDSERAFFILPIKKAILQFVNDEYLTYQCFPFYHPYSKLFIKELNRCGVEGLLNRNLQLSPQKFHPLNTFNFTTEYSPASMVKIDEEYKQDIIDFKLSGAYSVYNWELFFHTPLYLACKLNQNQKYEEAMKWFHYIFNPMDKSAKPSPQKFWNFKAFFELSAPEARAQEIRNILQNIKEHAAEVNAWLNDPYKPHLVARTRPVAYQRTVVMKYVDNIIDWADQLFRQDSMEATNEATLLYVLAYEVLGRRPVILPKKENAPSTQNRNSTFTRNYHKIKESDIFEYLYAFDDSLQLAFNSLETINSIADPVFAAPAYYQQVSQYPKVSLTSIRNRLPVGIQNNIPFKPLNAMESVQQKAQYRKLYIASPQQPNSDPLPRIDATNFCIPFNDDMLKYWDTVEDRLFKLRNSMNIEGIVRELPLFEPPIDPAVLVRAVAGGLSIGEALNDITAPQPYYRFRTIMQKAIEFTGEVKQMGDKLLSALEKKDAETLNILRSTQEINMQQAMKQVRKLQIDEANENIDNLNALIATVTARKEYYASREFMNKRENTSFGLSNSAGELYSQSSQKSSLASLFSLIPDFTSGVSGLAGSPVATILFGGRVLSNELSFIAAMQSNDANDMDRKSSLVATIGGYERRMDDWTFQVDMADMELQQLDCQLAAAEIRLMMAEKEMENLEMQIEQSQSVKEYYQDKYTNEALYNWMITQISSLYFQAYKLAYDMAKKAEKCYQHELGIYEATGFIQFGYWDSLKKGLLSGDKLTHDLHLLEAAYLDKNRRTLELTKHISLAQMFPEVLLDLITGKEATLKLEEFIFDMDYPGHYMRRIKSVSVTIPNVAGPYTTVSFMLTLNAAKVRKNSRLLNSDVYNETPIGNDPRFVYQTGGNITQSICTSSAQNDSGMFELNFGDERYLPFENAGVISDWRLSLPAGCDQFDLSTISDVILHVNYTALYDGNLATAAKIALEAKLPTAGTVLVSLKQQFPDAWNEMKSNQSDTMDFEFKMDNLPYFLRAKYNALQADKIDVMVVSKNTASVIGPPTIDTGIKENPLLPISLSTFEQIQDTCLYYGSRSVVVTSEPDSPQPINVTWSFAFRPSQFAIADIKDVIIVLNLKEELSV
jgi:hypothetical protein